ncbi:MAG: hypothetical protein NZ952_03715 [Candidatus Bathyarchaeota archaeon]|nr:hypothetical protein [Candidatus Bathyarchaeota archaeon]
MLPRRLHKECRGQTAAIGMVFLLMVMLLMLNFMYEVYQAQYELALLDDERSRERIVISALYPSVASREIYPEMVSSGSIGSIADLRSVDKRYVVFNSKNDYVRKYLIGNMNFTSGVDGWILCKTEGAKGTVGGYLSGEGQSDPGSGPGCIYSGLTGTNVGPYWLNWTCSFVHETGKPVSASLSWAWMNAWANPSAELIIYVILERPSVPFQHILCSVNVDASQYGVWHYTQNSLPPEIFNATGLYRLHICLSAKTGALQGGIRILFDDVGVLLEVRPASIVDWTALFRMGVNPIDVEKFRLKYVGHYSRLFLENGNISLGGMLGDTLNVSGSYRNLSGKDDVCWTLRSYGINELINSYIPSGYILVESTEYVNGSLANLAADEGLYMIFRSYPLFRNETRYFTSNNQTINGLQAFALGVNQTSSYVQRSASRTGQRTCTWGIRVWKRSASGIETEITNGTMVATVTRSTSGSGIQSSSWNCPLTVTSPTDAIVIRVYASLGGPDNLLAEFVTGQLNTSQIGSATWTVYYWTQRSFQGGSTYAYFRFGDLNYNSRIEGFSYQDRYVAEVEFLGSSDTEEWLELTWGIDCAWTEGLVNVTAQLYDYSRSVYPVSGDGYISYISSSTPAIDETKNQTITVDATNFRDAAGNWRIKIRGVKYTATRFYLKVDYIVLSAKHYTIYISDWYAKFILPSSDSITQVSISYYGSYTEDCVTQRMYALNHSSLQWIQLGEADIYESSGVGCFQNRTISAELADFINEEGVIEIRLLGQCAGSSAFYCYADYLGIIAYVTSHEPVSVTQRIFIWDHTEKNWIELSTVTIGGSDVTQELYLEAETIKRHIGPEGDVRVRLYGESEYPVACYANLLVVNEYRLDRGSMILEIMNIGPLTVELVSIWVINSTSHDRITIDPPIILSPGSRVEKNLNITSESSRREVKVVTRRGSIAYAVLD